jgi:ATP-binding cassette subfamily B (MDR/TAP) protein 1
MSSKPPTTSADHGSTADRGGNSSANAKKDERKRKNSEQQQQASTTETLSFVFEDGSSTKAIFILGLLGAIGNGFVYPILAYVLSSAYSQLSGAAVNGMHAIRSISYKFMVFGTYALFVGMIQTSCFEIVSYRASKSFRLHWFRALLRQDPAFFDVYDIGGLATTVGSNANKYRFGIGLRFGQGIQFLTTAVAGVGYALYANWRVALVVFGFLPFASFAALAVIKINQSKGARSAEAYKTAGGVAYSTVSAIKTVLSLNAIPQMIDHYASATADAFKTATKVLWKQGFLNGTLKHDVVQYRFETDFLFTRASCRSFDWLLHCLILYLNAFR